MLTFDEFSFLYGYLFNGSPVAILDGFIAYLNGDFDGD
jgi:hypothetical protein